MLRQQLATFEETRAISEPLPRGSAPYTSSNSFKTQRPGFKPKAKRWDHRLSLESRNRLGSTLKASASILKPSTMISLGTARPAPQYFPWESIMIHGMGNRYQKEEKAINSPALMSCTRGEEEFDLAVALNYGYAAGSPQVLRFVTEHVELIHNPPYDDWESCLTCGTTSAIEIAFRMFCNPGDWILAEAHTYTGAIETAKPLGINILGVKMDDKGLLPDDLDLKLRTWDAGRGPRPFILYTIPSGQNPTGTTQTPERRRAIYQVAEWHDLYIIEDDPYYLLQLHESARGTELENNTPLRADEYLSQLPASYLSLDLSGRVLRLDSTSKIIAPGLRCGWMTGCSQIVEKFLNHTEVSTVSPSGPSQLMLYKLLDAAWGHEGFIDWLTHLSQQYRQRRNTLIEACRRHLPPDICQWTVPSVGMFLWIRLQSSRYSALRPKRHVDEVQVSQLEIEDRIHARAKENGVLVSKGSWFATENNQSSDVCFRMTFAAATEDSLDQAIERFGNAVRTELRLV